MSNRQKLKTAKQFTALHSVCLEFCDSDAREVSVAGSFNDWSPRATPMIALGNGLWAKQLVLPPGHHEYRFVVDGHWVDDPKAREFVSNSHGSRNAVLIVEAT